VSFLTVLLFLLPIAMTAEGLRRKEQKVEQYLIYSSSLCSLKQYNIHSGDSGSLATMQSKEGISGTATASAATGVVGPHTPHNTSPTQANYSAKQRFTKMDLENYKDYNTTIKLLEEQKLEEKAEAQPLVIEQAAMQRYAACQRWRNAKAAEVEAKKELENLDKWNIGKLLPKSKRGVARQEARRIERQQQLDYTVAAVNRAFMELETAKTRLNEDESERNSLRSRLSDLYLARCNKNALVERMFSHPNWDSDPILAPLRLEIQELEQQATESCTDDGPYCKTYKILTLSKDKIHHLMEDFRSNSTMDLFQGNPSSSNNVVIKRGLVIIEPQHRQSILAANELLQLVAEEVETARKVLPVLPFHDDSLIDAARHGIFEPILSPDFVGNVEGQIKLKKCMQTLVQLKKEVLNCLQYAQRNVTRDSREAPVLKQLRMQITAKREQMAEYQHSVLEAALSDM
jgi:hypothetical protein